MKAGLKDYCCYRLGANISNIKCALILVLFNWFGYMSPQHNKVI